MRAKLLVLSLSCGLLLCDHTVSQAAENKQSLTLESIFASDEFRNKSLQNLQWDSDGSSFTFTKRNRTTGLLDIHKHDIATGNSRLLVAGNDIKYEGNFILILSLLRKPDSMPVKYSLEILVYGSVKETAIGACTSICLT